MVEEIIVVCNDDDGSVADICRGESVGLSQFKPPKRDVLAEFYHARDWQDNDIIVRITSDCVFIDNKEIDNVIGCLTYSGADYAYNRFDDPYSNPMAGEGQDVEVFTGKTLKTAYQLATDDYDREHCTPYMRKGQFKVAKSKTPKTYGSSINTIEDYYKILEILK